MKKSKLIYKIITIVTLVAPMTIYLFLSATLFNVNADITVKNLSVSDLIVEGDFIYTNNENVAYDGVTVYNEGQYGFFVDEDTIIKTDEGYYNYKLEELNATELRKETSYKLPMAFLVSVFGVGIVVLVINRKMQWYKDYPRLFVLISLVMGWVVLMLLNVIVSNLLTVFAVATLSWAIYCIEYMVRQGMLDETDAKKADSKLLATLKELTNG
jgi:hypothetical protein